MLRLKCIKFDFGWGSAPDPGGGSLQRSPRPPAVFKGAYFPTSRGREGRGREEEREGKEGVRKKERGGRGKGKGGESVPLALILQFDHCVTLMLCLPLTFHVIYLPGQDCVTVR